MHVQYFVVKDVKIVVNVFIGKIFQKKNRYLSPPDIAQKKLPESKDNSCRRTPAFSVYTLVLERFEN